jgi:hypothetical protein
LCRPADNGELGLEFCKKRPAGFPDLLPDRGEFRRGRFAFLLHAVSPVAYFLEELSDRVPGLNMMPVQFATGGLLFGAERLQPLRDFGAQA